MAKAKEMVASCSALPPAPHSTKPTGNGARLTDLLRIARSPSRKASMRSSPPPPPPPRVRPLGAAPTPCARPPSPSPLCTRSGSSSRPAARAPSRPTSSPATGRTTSSSRGSSRACSRGGASWRPRGASSGSMRCGVCGTARGESVRASCLSLLSLSPSLSFLPSFPPPCLALPPPRPPTHSVP